MDVQSAQFLPKVASRPMLPGSLQVWYVRCGTAGCRCARGELHGPYVRRYWREDGRSRARYVRRADLAATQQALAAWRRVHPSLRSLLRELRALGRTFKETTDGR